MTISSFGRLPDGTAIDQATISGGGLTVNVIGLGAALRDMRLDADPQRRPLVLGLKTVEDYLAHSPSMGIVAGRYANRIGKGRFTLGGTAYQLTLNERGRTHLHGGGRDGFGFRPWTVIDSDPHSVTFQIASPDGDQGYPGAVEATVSYRIDTAGDLSIELVATTDAPTILNLATHGYFNLDGGGDILDHVLEIPADSYTPVDGDLIPTGEIAQVGGTPFDFRRARPVRYMIDGRPFRYDHNYCIDSARSAEPRLHARLTGPKSGITLEVFSTEPGVQFYDGAGVNVPVPGTDDRILGPRAGLCLEPQLYPDTPNNPQFGSAVLRPDEVYRQVTRYRLSL